MAMIKCPECGAEISDKATSCIKCGCPISGVLASALIKFDDPAVIRYKCTVICDGKEYTCKQGESVEIPMVKASEIQISVSGGYGKLTTTVNPGRRYKVEFKGGFFGNKPVITAE